VAFALLEDGLQRARQFVGEQASEEDELLQKTIERLTLVQVDSLSYLQSAGKDSVNVVFLDPMFPERKKTAQVKKQMTALQELVGKDEDADQLLDYALNLAENRVVVKRPNHAPFLADHLPSYQLKGKSSRFDIYAKKKLV
jgi:16S rRNA (guanine1516-N2)-methyltransferase